MDERLYEQVVGAAMEVHTHLGGPGLLESIYESALCHELALRKIAYQRQIPVPVLYKGAPVRAPLFLDILVENQLVIEVKALEKDTSYYQAQLFTHLRFLGISHGVLINFGKKSLQEGISRVCLR